MTEQDEKNRALAKSVVDAILQKPDEVKVGDEVYTISPPSIATLMLVSREIRSQKLTLPDSKENLWKEMLSLADSSEWIGEVMAIFILGAKRIDEEATEEVTKERKYLFGLITKEETISKTVKLKDKLKEQILTLLTPMEVSVLLSYLLNGMQIDHFFELSTFLGEINLLRRTKKVEPTETTASGLPSQE